MAHTLAAAEHEEAAVVINCTMLEALSASMLADEVLAPWLGRYRCLDASPSYMSDRRRNPAAPLWHIASRRLSRECCKACSHESAVAVLRRSLNTARPLLYSKAVGFCLAVRLDQAISLCCKATSSSGTVIRSVYGSLIVFYSFASFKTETQNFEQARGSPRS